MKKAVKRYAGALYVAAMTAAVLVVLSCTDELSRVGAALSALSAAAAVFVSRMIEHTLSACSTSNAYILHAAAASVA